MKVKIDIREALAVANYAFITNENKVIKDHNSDEISTGQPNKRYLLKYFGDSNLFPEIQSIILTEDHYTAADQIKIKLDIMVMMETLKQGKINKFIQSCINLVNKEFVHVHDFAYLIWIPKLIHDNDLRNVAAEQSAFLEHTSKYIGQLGDKIEFYFNLIEKRYIGKIFCWTAYGYTNEGNLIKFLTKHENLCASQKLKARIKSLDKDKYHNNAMVTSLNHVKAA